MRNAKRGSHEVAKKLCSGAAEECILGEEEFVCDGGEGETEDVVLGWGV